MKRVATDIAASEPRIDVLINNAGAMFGFRQLTEDGFERTFALNHLAYFVLTGALRERLLASAPARVINTSSDAHQAGTLDLDDLQSERAYRSGLWEWARFGGAGYQSLRAIEVVQHPLHARARQAARRHGCHCEQFPSGLRRHPIRRSVRRAAVAWHPCRKTFRPLAGAGRGDARSTWRHRPTSQRVTGEYFVRCRPAVANPCGAGRRRGATAVAREHGKAWLLPGSLWRPCQSLKSVARLTSEACLRFRRYGISAMHRSRDVTSV